jgi:benzoate membrane transport protein
MVAVLVGFGGSVAIILADATAVDAGAAETLSWVSALCFATAVTTAVPSVRHRMLIIMARSTPGAALIDASTSMTLSAAVGAFMLALNYFDRENPDGHRLGHAGGSTV